MIDTGEARGPASPPNWNNTDDENNDKPNISSVSLYFSQRLALTSHCSN